jgi:uncharacterized membrane protein YeiH
MLYILDLAGVTVFAISGALAGFHRGLDLFGIVVLASVTAIGGGTLRDVLLSRTPIFWVAAPSYLYVILVAALLTFVAPGFFIGLGSPMLIADAFGLGLFAISGAQVAEAQNRSWIVIVLMGTMTGVAGGVIRDLLSGVVPVLLRRDIYASAAMVGIIVYLLLRRWRHLRQSLALPIAVAIVVTVRLLALRYGWQLPTAQSIGNEIG